MSSRMQHYRARMKARGLMQVTVWASPEHAQQIRDFAQSLLERDVHQADAEPASEATTARPPLTVVTGDEQAAPAPLSQPAAPEAEIVTGDIPDATELAAAEAEVASEIATWDAELEMAEELARHDEVLQELRQWLKELDSGQTAMRTAIENQINSRRKVVKSLRRARKRNGGA